MKNKNKKKILFNNKKGAISGIISGAGSLIQTMFRTFPKPVLFIIFLALILFLGTIIQSSLFIFGIYCNSADRPVSLGMNVFTNIGLISQIPNPEDIGLEARETGEWGYTAITTEVTKCSRQIHHGIIVYDDGREETFLEPRWFYDGSFCTNCETGTIYETSPDNTTMSSATWCVDRIVSRVPDEQKNWFKRQLCGAWLGCEPPEHYYYDSYKNLYICEDETCGDITMGQTWDELLTSKGATPLYYDIQTQRTDYKGFITIKCRDLKPRITTFGIEIFDYRIWVILMLLALMIWGLKNFG